MDNNTDLVMHLTFNNDSGTTATDTSPYGQNNSATLRNGAVISPIISPLFAPLLGKGITLDGIDDYVFIDDSSDINLRSTNQRTVSLWFNATDTSVSNDKQILFEEGGTGAGLNVYLHNGALYVGGWSGSNWRTFLSTNSISSNQWHNVTFTLDATNNTFTGYLNGTQFGQGRGGVLSSHGDEGALGALSGMTQFHDGNVSGTGSNAFAGSLDEFRLYNRTLSTTEITSLVNQYSPPPLLSPSADPALVMRLEFNQNLTNIAADTSFFGNNHPSPLLNGAKFASNNTLSLDGINDYVHINDSSDINLKNIDQRTVSLWFNAVDPSVKNDKQVLFEEGGYGNGLNIYLHDGKLYAGGWSGNYNWQTFLSTNLISANQWHNVTLTLNAHSRTFAGYLDGVKFGQGSSNTLASHGDDAALGAITGSTKFHDSNVSGIGNHAFEGSLDEFRLYNRTLSATEIIQLSQLNRPTPLSTTPEPTPAPLPAPVVGTSFAKNDTVYAITNQSLVITPYSLSQKSADWAKNALTISSVNLLANDQSVTNPSVQIVGASKAERGTVSYQNGTIVFTPEANYTGQGSFEYTVKDGNGKTATAKVTVNLNTPDYDIGTNFYRVNYFSPSLSFTDAFKFASPWFTSTQSVWNTREDHLLNLDENGWVKSLPSATAGVQYDSISTVIFPKGSSTVVENGQTVIRHPGGTYVLFYEGEGTFEYRSNGVKQNTALSSAGRSVIEISPDSNVVLRITATDPKNTGNYLRNFHLVPIEAEAEYRAIYRQNATPTQIAQALVDSPTLFNPLFQNSLEPYSTLRFMDWMETNYLSEPWSATNPFNLSWDERPQVTDYSWGIDKGVPIEIMVELANRTQSDAWFNIPINADDNYVRQFAQYVENHLDPNLKVYVEYSNEVWNGAYEPAQWAKAQGNATGLSANQVYSKRLTEILQIWDQVWATDANGNAYDSDRVIGVLAGQAANSFVASNALTFNWTNNPLTPQQYGIDAIAIAPYFGGYIPKADPAELKAWTNEADGGLTKLFDELTQGGQLSSSPQGGALQQAYNNIADHVALAQKHNLQLVAYEGGQHLKGDTSGDRAVSDLWIAANRDERMGAIYQQYLQQWFALGGGLFNHFLDVFASHSGGSWGTVESLYQTSSVKRDVLLDFIARGDG